MALDPIMIPLQSIEAAEPNLKVTPDLVDAFMEAATTHSDKKKGRLEDILAVLMVPPAPLQDRRPPVVQDKPSLSPKGVAALDEPPVLRPPRAVAPGEALAVQGKERPLQTNAPNSPLPRAKEGPGERAVARSDAHSVQRTPSPNPSPARERGELSSPRSPSGRGAGGEGARIGKAQLSTNTPTPSIPAHQTVEAKLHLAMQVRPERNLSVTSTAISSPPPAERARVVDQGFSQTNTTVRPAHTLSPSPSPASGRGELHLAVQGRSEFDVNAARMDISPRPLGGRGAGGEGARMEKAQSSTDIAPSSIPTHHGRENLSAAVVASQVNGPVPFDDQATPFFPESHANALRARAGEGFRQPERIQSHTKAPAQSLPTPVQPAQSDAVSRTSRVGTPFVPTLSEIERTSVDRSSHLPANMNSYSKNRETTVAMEKEVSQTNMTVTHSHTLSPSPSPAGGRGKLPPALQGRSEFGVNAPRTDISPLPRAGEGPGERVVARSDAHSVQQTLASSGIKQSSETSQNSPRPLSERGAGGEGVGIEKAQLSTHTPPPNMIVSEPFMPSELDLVGMDYAPTQTAPLPKQYSAVEGDGSMPLAAVQPKTTIKTAPVQHATMDRMVDVTPLAQPNHQTVTVATPINTAKSTEQPVSQSPRRVAPEMMAADINPAAEPVRAKAPLTTSTPTRTLHDAPQQPTVKTKSDKPVNVSADKATPARAHPATVAQAPMLGDVRVSTPALKERAPVTNTNTTPFVHNNKAEVVVLNSPMPNVTPMGSNAHPVEQPNMERKTQDAIESTSMSVATPNNLSHAIYNPATPSERAAPKQGGLKQRAEAIALNEANKAPAETKYKFDWGGDQSVVIEGTSETGYTLRASDNHVKQILDRHLTSYEGSNGALPLGINAIESATDRHKSGQRQSTHNRHGDDRDE